MSYLMSVSERDVLGPKKYVNSKGNTECVEFVQQVTGAPVTTMWKRGVRVKDAGIQVLDQWNAQGKVLPRTIRFNHAGKRSDNGDMFYVIE